MKQAGRQKWRMFVFFSLPLRDTLDWFGLFLQNSCLADVCKHEHVEEPVSALAHNSLNMWPWTLKPKYAQNRLYNKATTNIAVSNKELLSLALSFTVKNNQQDSTEQERIKPHGTDSTKAGIIQGIIQEQLTFLNRTIPSTRVKNSNITYYTWHNKSIILFPFLLASLVSSHSEKWLMWDNKRSNKERIGNPKRMIVFLWGYFKWQRNRCPLKGWRGLINLDCSGLCLASFEKNIWTTHWAFFPILDKSLAGWFDIIRIAMALLVVYLLWEFL